MAIPKIIVKVTGKKPYWNVEFKYGVQTFYLRRLGENKEDALWMARMLRHAFDKHTTDLKEYLK